MRRFGVSKAAFVILALASGIALWGSVSSRSKAAVLDPEDTLQGTAACTIAAPARAGVRPAPRDYQALIQRHIAFHRLAGERLASLGGRSLVPLNPLFQPNGVGGRPGSSAEPVPIPGGLFDGAFHVWVPGPTEFGLMGLDVEPDVITNFNGFAAIAFFVGTARGSDGIDYDMMDDMRVYSGAYISDDGTHHHGTFVFV